MLCKSPRLRLETFDGHFQFISLPSDTEILKYRHLVRDRVIKRCDLIPCNNCVGCRLEYSRDWQCRLLCELSTTNSPAYFITLTYDDSHLHFVDGCLPDTGEYRSSSTLVKSDVQLFLKRLRKFTDNKLSYYLCGEYGDSTHRPHYHLALFGCDFLNDLKFYSFSEKCGIKSKLYQSKILDSVWNLGNCLIGDLNSRSAGYIARYILKKQKGQNSKLYKSLNILPPFTLSSRKPAIGLVYLDSHYFEIAKSNSVILSTELGRKEFRIPRYFLDKLSSRYPDLDFSLYRSSFLDFQQTSQLNFDEIFIEESDISIIEQKIIDYNSNLSKLNLLKRR